MSFCQNDSPNRGSFWQKDSLITHILFELHPIMILSLVSNFDDHSILSIVFLGPLRSSRTSSVYYPDELNCSDTSRIEALPKDLLSALELLHKSDQGKATVKSDDYYTRNGRKKSQQIDPPDLDQIINKTCSIRIPCINDGKPRVFEPPRALKFIGKHTLNIVYGMLGSILASALTGAIYSIITGSDTENSSETFFTTRSITGIATKITTQPTISNLYYSSITQPTTNLGTQGLLHCKCFVC